MIHPDTELRFKNPAIGYGVFATRAIPKGSILWTLCDLDIRFTPAAKAGMAAPYQAIIDRYAYIDAAGDAILCWDNGRYVNHSCTPAMLGVGPEVEIAVADIAAGDEITCDYGTLNLLEPLACGCGAPHCRGTIGSADMLQLWSELDQKAAEALRAFKQVPQPLLAFVRKPAELLAWIDGSAPIPSSRTYHHAQS